MSPVRHAAEDDVCKQIQTFLDFSFDNASEDEPIRRLYTIKEVTEDEESVLILKSGEITNGSESFHRDLTDDSLKNLDSRNILLTFVSDNCQRKFKSQ